MSCSKVYTKLCYLENHLCLGNHVYNSKKENQFDSIKKAWASQCVAVEREHKVLVRATAPSTVLVSNNEGWALKTSKSVKRFSTKVKDYISSIHQYFNTTGKRPNFEDIAEELKTKRDDDGNKVFKQEEWLSPSQIRSLFSNFVRKNAQSIEIHTGTQKETKNDEDLQQALAEIDALEYHADMVVVTEDELFEVSSDEEVNDEAAHVSMAVGTVEAVSEVDPYLSCPIASCNNVKMVTVKGEADIYRILATNT
ncbi:Hypothetical predicted protein [Mytilus galloprovincialis]|uniref:Uncharacterized protein n=1 Tax=Mytilus galloprovincialis TaxID=29158 RepID=A0A8B6EJ77_MYTGA|nr:Hypothetical predicted protein [Mytilus galloprovincialis]